MQELNLTLEQSLSLIVILLFLAIFLWFGVGLGSFQLDVEPEIKLEGKDTRPLKNELYGAYIQAQGRYYN